MSEGPPLAFGFGPLNTNTCEVTGKDERTLAEVARSYHQCSALQKLRIPHIRIRSFLVHWLI